MKIVKSFRIDQELIDEAEKQNVNLVEVITAAIAKSVKDKRCPYCKQKIKNK